MDKIKRVSWFFRMLFQILFIVLPVVLAMSWMQAPQSMVLFNHIIELDTIPKMYSAAILHPLTHMDKLLGFALSLLPLLVELFILYFLIKLFRLYEQGEIFHLNNVKYIRNIGYTLLIGQILVDPIYQAFMGVILTWHNPPGHRFAGITLNQTNVGILLTALLVILISWIMAEGCKLREEQQLTV